MKEKKKVQTENQERIKTPFSEMVRKFILSFFSFSLRFSEAKLCRTESMSMITMRFCRDQV